MPAKMAGVVPRSFCDPNGPQCSKKAGNGHGRNYDRSNCYQDYAESFNDDHLCHLFSIPPSVGISRDVGILVLSISLTDIVVQP